MRYPVYIPKGIPLGMYTHTPIGVVRDIARYGTGVVQDILITWPVQLFSKRAIVLHPCTMLVVGDRVVVYVLYNTLRNFTLAPLLLVLFVFWFFWSAIVHPSQSLPHWHNSYSLWPLPAPARPSPCGLRPFSTQKSRWWCLAQRENFIIIFLCYLVCITWLRSGCGKFTNMYYSEKFWWLPGPRPSAFSPPSNNAY